MLSNVLTIVWATVWDQVEGKQLYYYWVRPSEDDTFFSNSVREIAWLKKHSEIISKALLDHSISNKWMWKWRARWVVPAGLVWLPSFLFPLFPHFSEGLVLLVRLAILTENPEALVWLCLFSQTFRFCPLSSWLWPARTKSLESILLLSTDNDVSTVTIPLNKRLSTHCLCICVHLACNHNHAQTLCSPHSTFPLIAPLGHHRACITVAPWSSLNFSSLITVV